MFKITEELISAMKKLRDAREGSTEEIPVPEDQKTGTVTIPESEVSAPEQLDTSGTEQPVGGIDDATLARYKEQWEKEQNVKLQELTDSWGIEKAGLQQQLGGLENQVGNLNLTIGASEAQNRAYANELKTLQEANIKATERERLIARYGSALQGAPEDPKVHGVKTAKIKDQPNQRWYTPRNQFNRTGMRITNLNI